MQVQNNKQILSSYAKKTNHRDIAPYRIPDESSKINPKWSQEEQLLGVQGTYVKRNFIFDLREGGFLVETYKLCYFPHHGKLMIHPQC